MDLRSFLAELDRRGELKRVKEKLSPKYEIPRRLVGEDKAVLFERVKGSKFKVVANVCGTRDRISLGLGTNPDHLTPRLLDAMRKPGELEPVPKAPAQEVIEDHVNLEELPILTHFEGDGGPYITAGVVIAKDKKGRRNVSFHRLQLIGRNKLAIRLVPRHLFRIHQEAEREGQSLEVAIVIGLHPAILMAAATSPEYGRDELRIASSLLGGRLQMVSCKTVDLRVPAHSEIVLEGKILPKKRIKEGPFCDILGTYDIVRPQPVVEVQCITMRRGALYQALLPGGLEHRLLMGMPQEPKIFQAVGKVSKVKEVHLTPGGCGWLHAVISISKRAPADGRKAIATAMRAHPSLKHVVVVDDDIDVHDLQQVEWAIATRVRADRDVLLKVERKGSTLDPMADRKRGRWAKLGIDATKELKNVEKFERAKIPGEE